MLLRSLSTAKAELEPVEEPLDEPPVLEELVALLELVAVAPAPVDVEAADEEELEALLVPEPETVSPTSPERETIVPLLGA